MKCLHFCTTLWAIRPTGHLLGGSPKGLFTARELKTVLNSTPVRELQYEQQHWSTRVENWPSTNRPSFATPSQLVTPTRVANERVV